MLQRRARLRREGTRSIVDLDGCASTTVQSRLDEIGFGAYQLTMLVGVGGALLSECLEMGSVAPMHTALARAYGLSRWERSLLPMFTFIGAGAGLMASGPLCDWRGRKLPLLLSLLTIAAVMLATAALPAAVDTSVLLALRFLSGMAGAMGAPAGLVLAVESCPGQARSRFVFGIQIMGALGYLLASCCVLLLMPDFGEAESDSWRAFCVVIGAVALLAMPFAMLLEESPTFLAVTGDADRCVGVLDHIATANGKKCMQDSVNLQLPHCHRGVVEVADGLWNMLQSQLGLLLLLSAIECSRSYFVSGSSYLWKDLFQMLEGRRISPPLLNIVASTSPLIGLAISERLLRIGVRRIVFCSSVLAACALLALTSAQTRMEPWKLLSCVMVAKLAYGPLTTCIALIKAESFPTEIRVSAFSLISVAAKATCTLAPTLVEALKGDELATSWDPARLSCYVLFLMTAVLLCGVLTLLVPGRSGDGRTLREFFDDPSRIKGSRSYGTMSDAWEAQSGSESEADTSKVPRSRTLPSLSSSLPLPAMRPCDVGRPRRNP